MEDNATTTKKTPIWQNCIHCPSLVFSTPAEFERHIQDRHSIKEGSIILCQYGPNGMCSSLQFGDLRKAGFKYHVREYHEYAADASNDKWTYYSSSLNLPAVLNDPHRGKQSNFFTKTWGDSFVDKVDIYPSPYLPEITLKHFESYCKKISKRYNRHCRLKESAATKAKTPTADIDCNVPEIFFEQTLALHNPEVFDKVFPNLSNAEDISTAIRPIQETLSTYLDVIEIKISKQVAQKSDAFFHAMLSQDTIMEQMAQATKVVKETRQKIAQVKGNLTEIPLNLVSLTRTNQNLQSVHELLKLIGTVQQTQPMIQLLLSTSDYVAALDLISSTQKVLATRLKGIQAFRHLSPQLTEMKRLIHKMLSNEFQKFIVNDLSRPSDDYTETPERDKIISILSGIFRLKEFDFIDTFKIEAMTSIQTIIKQSVIEIVSKRDGNAEIVLRGSNADNTYLRCNEGIVFLEKVGPNLIVLFRRILTMHNLVLEISQMEDVTGIESEDVWTEEELKLTEEKLKKAIASLTEYCHERCANLIVTKTDKDIMFSDLSQLSKLSKAIEHFSDECEQVTGYNNNALKLALRSFAMKFIQNLHSERRAQLTASLNSEKWKSADVPIDLQIKINIFCEIDDILPITDNTETKTEAKYLVLNNENYSVVATVQVLIKILLEYCEAIKQSPIVVQYLVHCMLELIRHFNSRCCQLVLGAGAIQSAGLKTISTSNLALVSRSLQVVLWLLPSIKNLLETLHSKELSLNGFASVENDLISHKKEIENKICTIVSGMLCSQLTTWDAKPPVPSQTFRNISKHLVKLHEALIDILPLEQIMVIYKRVHDNFKDKLREQLAKMNIVANGSPQHGVVTSELTFYIQTLKTLRVISDNSNEDNILYDVWLN